MHPPLPFWHVVSRGLERSSHAMRPLARCRARLRGSAVAQVIHVPGLAGRTLPSTDAAVLRAARAMAGTRMASARASGERGYPT